MCKMSDLGYSYPGLPSATGTRVDSASKHIMACKVNETQMMTWCEDTMNARNHLHIQKYKYCMNRDDLMLNTGNALNDCSTDVVTSRAYPAVVSNLGDMTPQTQHILKKLYHVAKNGKDYLEFKSDIRRFCTRCLQADVEKTLGKVPLNADMDKVKREVRDLPHFTAQGYALGVAYASHLSGDTVGSVLIGGMVTVRNGHFNMKAGQLVQWYFDFEVDMFHRQTEENNKPGGRLHFLEGMRRSVSNKDPSEVEKESNYVMTDAERQRKEYHDRELGAVDAMPIGGNSSRKHNVFYPKPFVLCSDGSEHYGDKMRIFAKCINGGRKHEMVDLMLMTQSL